MFVLTLKIGYGFFKGLHVSLFLNVLSVSDNIVH